MRFLGVAPVIACFISVAIMGISCSRNTLQDAGWGSETTNGVTASVYKSDGSAAAGVLVRLRKSDYVTSPMLELSKSAIYKADALTDAQGRFEIRGVDPGAYRIEVGDPSACPGRGGAVLFTCSIGAHDTVDLSADTLRPFAVARGLVDISVLPGKTLFVQVPGLERLALVDSAGTFEINDLPAGHFDLRVIAAQGAQTTRIRSDSVSVASGDTVIATMPGWKFFKRLYLNTTGNGANIGGKVYGFPVLIRLTNSNFHFAEAQAGGNDLRFAKPDGSMLSYEIEHWDAVAQTAEAWVKVDTVFGNDFLHFIMMYWGNSTAQSMSNAGAVFDTANGNIGVWHMNQIGNGPVLDATDNHYDGVSYNMAAASGVQGIIGNAGKFDGLASYVGFPGTANSKLNLPEKGSYTISAWAYTMNLDNKYYMIASKGNWQYNLQIMYTNSWEFAECRAAGGYTDVFSPAAVTTWSYLVGIRDGDKEYLYVNGTCTDSSISLLDTANIRNTGDDFTIGKMPNGSTYYFKGMIDDVRVLNRTVSADWIKLSYMNQQSRDSLIVFK
jgi:hypothetical protein